MGSVKGFKDGASSGRTGWRIVRHTAEGCHQAHCRDVDRNALEWYDIAVYGYFAIYVSKAFFPNEDQTASLLLTLGTFGLSYLARPIGGVVLGAYADRFGRKASLMVSIVMMTFGTLAVAVMPGYATIGILAPIAVILARLLQGFSAGGEFGSSTAFLVEHMPHRRGFVASWQFASQGLSGLLASGFGVWLTSTMTSADLESWGWRIPFLFGVLIGPIGIYIRNNIDDATAPPAAKKRVGRNPRVRRAEASGLAGYRRHRGDDLGQLPHRLHADLRGQNPQAAAVGGFPGGAGRRHRGHPAAADRRNDLGPDRAHHPHDRILSAVAGIGFSGLPDIDADADADGDYPGRALLGTLKALYFGPLAALMSELFPPVTRGTGLGLSYNIGVTVFGGMSPVTMAWMGSFAFFGNLAPGYYITLCGIVSLCALVTIRRTKADDGFA